MNNSMVTLMLMHDNGKSHTIRLRNFFYKSICTLIILLPILLGLTITACYYLWNDNKILNANALHLQNETNKAIALSENLTIFKSLLAENHPINASIVQINQTEELALANKQNEENATLAEQVGPGHVEFPAVDTEEVAVENISARILNDGKIRISLDLRNPDPAKIVTGYVDCSFVDSLGVNHPLGIALNLKGFKINRFKRVVFLSNISPDILDENGNVLIEVFNREDKLMYRNVTPIEQ